MVPAHGHMGLKTEGDILGGASGGPILTEDGKLVGVVSQTGGEQEQGRWGMHPHLFSALPGWAVREILAAEDEADHPRPQREWHKGALSEMDDSWKGVPGISGIEH